MNNTSYKDPSGFVFYENDKIYRQINKSYKDDYDYFISSGLYSLLVKKKQLVSHKEVHLTRDENEHFYKFIQPEKIDFITYSYEWCFSQLKDAALLTLEIQKTALDHNMILKDATSYNVQFNCGQPIFIDTLSFEKYREGTPWLAYKQFCQHFLAPLALMSKVDIRLNGLLKNYIDGIPLDLAAKLLPTTAKFNFGLLTHVFLHSEAQKKYENEDLKSRQNVSFLNRFGLNALLDSLTDCIKSLKLPQLETEWGAYYSNTNYSDSAFLSKKEIISDYIDKIIPTSVIDLGANKGDFSRISAERNIKTISCDIDPIAVEKNYLYCKKNKEFNILPLIIDLTNPTPDIGFMNDERSSFIKRSNVSLTMALALIHHLAISNNLPLKNIANFFSKFSEALIVEFIPKDDSKVQTLLASREDIFPDYNKACFEKSFSNYFEIINSSNVLDSKRVLYLMRKK